MGNIEPNIDAANAAIAPKDTIHLTKTNIKLGLINLKIVFLITAAIF